MELSKRLLAVASLVTPGMRIVDIGTDHAYIPIYLIEQKRSVSAVAMDVNKGPLGRAEEHIREAGFQNEIETRLSDGFEQMKPDETDCAIIAGMGGGLVMKILSAYPETTCSLQECVLQPQSEIAKVRFFLLQNGFQFVDEDMVLDDGKYYPMMKVIPPEKMKIPCEVEAESEDNLGKHKVSVESEGNTEKHVTAGVVQEENDRGTNDRWNETELRYGKLLLEKKHPVLKDFLQREYHIHKKILDRLEDKTGDEIERRKKELKEDLSYIEKGLNYYAV